MPPKKLIRFLGDEKFYEMVNEVDRLFNFDQKTDFEKHRKVLLFLYHYFRERLSGPTLKNFAKEILDFLSDEEIDNLLNFVHQNFFELREKLWQEEPEEVEKVEEIKPETFEEKEKKYHEIMSPLIQKQKQEKKKEVKTISFEPSQEPIKIKEQETEILPETTIIIKKTEEEVKKEGDETLDLSKL